ncbi:MAG: hypothetical protein GYB55_22435 [Cytophagales bacterium]|nr:hypothetical protein [Cytophagales bacterium]
MDMKLLFSHTPRKQSMKSKFSQRSYDFLDNSNWGIAHEVRSILQDWSNDFNPDNDFLSSFKTEEHFQSQFFELFIWKYFTALGFSIDKSDRDVLTTIPDFLCADGQSNFFIECTTVKFRQEQIKNKILDTIENMALPSIWFSINFRKSSNRVPSLKRIREEINFQLSQSSDSFEFNNNDWIIKFRTYPKNEKMTTNVFSIYGGNSKNDGFLNLQNSLQKKAKMNYDINSKPFILAVNTNDVFLKDEEFLKILYGKVEGKQSNLQPTREDSLFLSKGDLSKNRHISAVLICNNLTPWHMDSCKISLWHNPNANIPFSSPSGLCDSVTIKENDKLMMTRKEGIHPSTHINLTPNYYLKSKLPV